MADEVTPPPPKETNAVELLRAIIEAADETDEPIPELLCDPITSAEDWLNYERVEEPPNDALLIPAALVAKAVEWMKNMESESDGEPDLEWLRVRRGLQERLPPTKVAAPVDPDEETPCRKREDGLHCECWYGGNKCCGCGDGDRTLGGEWPTCTEVRAVETGGSRDVDG